MLRTLFACVATDLLVSIPVRPAAIQADQPTATDKVTITGWALNMSNVATGTNQTIQITIDRWSTPAQRQLLIDTFMQKKQDGLLRELEKQPRLGRFNFPGYMGPDPNNVMRLGTDINYARSFTGEDGGRRIVIITPVSASRRIVPAHMTIHLPSSRCALTRQGRGRDGWLTVRVSISTRRRTRLRSRTIRVSPYASTTWYSR